MSRSKDSEQATRTAITRGDFRECYLLYCRRSTDEADSQKNSLSFQSREINAYVTRTGLKVAKLTVAGFCKDGAISEKHSGFKESDTLTITKHGAVQYDIERPKFLQLVQHLNAGHFKGVVVLCWDRLSRNQGDDTVLRKLKRKGIDLQFVYATYDDSSSGELHMDIDGMFAQHHSRVTSEKVRLAMNAQRAQGKYVSRAPVGYLNEGNADFKPFDPERAPILKELFELCATGDWSLSDLCRHANRQGFRTVPRRRRRTQAEILADDEDETHEQPKRTRPLTINHLGKILRNPFYAGRIADPNGQYIPSVSHDALVDAATFAKVQEKLADKRVSVHYTEKLDHPMRGMVRCAQCHRVYTPYQKKGILYYNARCTPDCANTFKNCNLVYVTDLVRQVIAKLRLTEEELATLDAAADTEIAQIQAAAKTAAARRERERAHTKEKLDYLNANQLELLTSGAYSPKALAEERLKLETQLAETEKASSLDDANLREVLQHVRNVSERLNTALNLVKFAKPAEIELLAKSLVSELLIDQNTFSFSPRSGLKPIFERKCSNGAPLDWISELSPPELDEVLSALKCVSKLLR